MKSVYIARMVNEATLTIEEVCAALLLSQELSSNSGSNELTGKTLNGLRWQNDEEAVKDTTKTYTFTSTDYTYTDSIVYPKCQEDNYRISKKM